jgi:glycosyltransferase involved in cell wall biosynthesis
MGERLKVSYVVDHLAHARAGTENQLFMLLPELSHRYGYELELVCLRENDWLASQSAFLGCTVRFFEISNFKSPSAYLNWWRLVRHYRESQPDIVHSFFPVANIVGVLAAVAGGVRGVVSSRRDYGEWMRRRYLAVTRFANYFTAGIITNSLAVKELTVRKERYPARKVRVIQNGIDLTKVRRPPCDDELRESLGIPAGHAVVTLVANFRPMKRHETLVGAAAQVLSKRRNVTFLCVGRDHVAGQPRRRLMMRLASEAGIDDHFRVVHADGNILQYLSITDIGVNCSYGEGISNAIMEYMACEIPVVAAASGGNVDLVRDGQTGLCFPVGDSAKLAAHVLQLLDDAALARRLGVSGRKMLHEQMSLDAMARAFCIAYESMRHGEAEP